VEARYTYRLRVSPAQQRALQEVFGACGFVWNTSLGRWSDLWRYEQVSLGYVSMAAELTDWRGRYEWLAAVPVTPQQQVQRDLDKAVRAFYDKEHPGRRPRFKKKGSHSTASWNANGFSLRDGRLCVAVKGGRTALRVVWSRALPSVPKTVTVRRDAAGRWWASFVVRVGPEDLGATGATTGLDVGLASFATTEFADADIPNPRFARQAAKALARSQRNLSRKAKGSANRAKAKTTTAKVAAHTASQRKDWQHKEARKVGHQIVRLDPRHTTQTCSGCGAKAKHRLGLADRTFWCDGCGLVEDRDRNAARNLNPDRWDKSVRVGQGVDGRKTLVPAGTEAA